MTYCRYCEDEIVWSDDGGWWHVNESNDEEEVGHEARPEEDYAS